MNSCTPARKRGIGFALALSLGIPSMGATTAPGAAARPPAPTTHTLYLGADLAIELNGKVRPVEDVQGNSFVVDVDHKRTVLRTGTSNLRLRIDSVMKITTTCAKLTGLKAERAYSTGADPRYRADEATDMTMDTDAQLDEAMSNLRTQESLDGLAGMSHFDREGHPDFHPLAPDAMNAQYDVIRSASFAKGSNLNSVSDAVANENAALREQRFDALDLSFDISSAQPLDDPYLVVFVRYLERPNDPKTTRLMVNARHIPAIGVDSHTVRMFRGGFPPGYQLIGYQIHLYNRGLEVATTAAPKQMALSRDDALQFYIIDYSTRNHDSSVPPSLAKMFWAEDLSPRLKNLPPGLAFFVRVGKDGKPLGVFEDAACTRRLANTEVAATAGDLRFFPALSQGKPVESILPVRIADLTL